MAGIAPAALTLRHPDRYLIGSRSVSSWDSAALTQSSAAAKTAPKITPVSPPADSAARSGEMAAQMSEQGSHDKILIVDFGSQVTQLIARRIREERVYCEIVPFQKAEQAFLEMRPKGVILSGGPSSVLDQGAPLAPAAIYDAG